MLKELQSRPDLILTIVQYEHRLRGAVEQFKAVARLADGTNLHINEVWIDGGLHKYAYYQIAPSGDVICGWDNAPHHPDVRTYPHHLHQAGDVYPSAIRSLSDVFDRLEKELT